MKKLLIALFFGLMVLPAGAQGRRDTLSSQAQISILTVDQWDQLWAAFGHSGLRIYDPVTGIDRAYDYGVFNFNSPTFYQDFTKGLLNYRVAAGSFDRFVRRYEVQQRWVKEQVLNLDSAQVQAVYWYVENNARPENAEYMYHYFYNNCATQLLDIFTNVMPEEVVFEDDHLEDEEHTIRGLVHDYLYMSPFAKFGIDLIMGSSLDKPATPREVAFLPDYTALAFANAKVKTNAGWAPMVEAERTVVNLPSLRERSFTHIFTPIRVMWLVFVLALFITWRNKKMAGVGRVFDWLLFLILGLGGTLMAFMWLGTDHVNCTNNYNLIWAWPSHAVLAFFLLKRSWSQKVRRYFRLVAIFTLLVVGLWWAWPQDLPNAAIPLVLAGVVRAGRVGFVN